MLFLSAFYYALDLHDASVTGNLSWDLAENCYIFLTLHVVMNACISMAIAIFNWNL